MKKILIIKHGALGDVVLSMYPIFSINNHFKNAKITILTESKYVEIFSYLSFVKNIKIDDRPKIYNFISHLRLIVWFCKSNFDWVFDLQTSKRTTVYYYIFSFFKKFNWSGITKKCSHPHLNKNRIKLHTIKRQREQLKIAGIKNFITPDWSELSKKRKQFNIKKPYVIVVPGGSKNRIKKRWNYNNYLEIIKYLRKKNYSIVFVGGSDEKSILNYRDENKYNIYNLIGKTNFSDLANIARNASFIIGNDTGPMHLLVSCSSLTTKKIVLFGEESDPKLCAPVGEIGVRNSSCLSSDRNQKCVILIN